MEEPGRVDYCGPAKTNQFEILDNWTLARSMDEEPTLLKEALEGLDGAEWKRGLGKEIGRLEAAKTWRVVKPPENATIIPHSILLKIKQGAWSEIIEHQG